MSAVPPQHSQRSDAFGSALVAQWNRLYRLAYAWCHDPDVARDLAQETLFKAWKTQGRIPEEKDMEVWLFRILTNCWRDHFRRHRETVDIDTMPLINHDSPDKENARAETLARVRHAIAALSMEQRQVFTLVAVEGLRYAEVATILEIPVGTVMSRLNRARQHLQKSLKDLSPDTLTSDGTVRRVK